MNNEYPSPVIPARNKDGSRNRTPRARFHRHMRDDDDAGDPIKCTGKSCQSCTAGLIADCVAVCCCPCAVVNILAFAFFKVPWTIGKRLMLKVGKKKKGNLEEKRKCELEWGRDLDGISRKRRAEGGTSEFVFSELGDEELKDNFSARFEAEELWLELYQGGHLSFGRVSFTGIPPPCV